MTTEFFGFSPEDRKKLKQIGRMDISDDEKYELQKPIFDEITARMKRIGDLNAVTCKLKECLSQAILIGMSKENITQLYDEVVVASWNNK